jgi:hypothetical protein
MADAAASSTLRREREVGREDERPGSYKSDTVTAGDRLDEVVRRCAVAGGAVVAGVANRGQSRLPGVMRSGLPAWGVAYWALREKTRLIDGI